MEENNSKATEDDGRTGIQDTNDRKEVKIEVN
jgi:hypothetical protein